MAFADKYTVTFADYEGVSWVVKFREDGFGGAATALTPSTTPVKIRWHSSDKYQTIIGSSADIQIVYQSEADDLFTEASQTIQVIINRDGTSVFQGYVSPGQYSRQFNQPKHYITITANDCLGELKEIKFEDGSGNPYYSQQTEMTAIANILAKTGSSLSIYEGINMWDTNHTAAAANSPLTQTYFYPEAYWDERTDERADCHTVLTDILKKYGASIKQVTGIWGTVWLIYRPNSFSVGSTIIRLFNSSGVYQDNTSFTNYRSLGSSLYYIHSNQELRKLFGIGSCTVKQTPPRRENMIKNGSFDSFTWNSGLPYYWTDNYSSGTSLELEESNGTMKIGSTGNTGTPTEYVETTVYLNFITSATLSFDWTPTYTGSPTYKELRVAVLDFSNSSYLTNAGEWSAGTTAMTITAPASGTTYAITIDIPPQDSASGYDRSWTLKLRFFEFQNENPPASNYYTIDNLRLDVDMYTADHKLHEYNNSVSINKSMDVDIALGDSWRSDFLTTTIDETYYINTYNAGTQLTSSWEIYGDTTSGAPIGEVLARQMVEGYRRALNVISGSIRSNSMLTSWLALRDSNFVDEYGFTSQFLPINIDYDARRNEWEGDWVESPATYNDSALEWSAHDFGGDAVITGNQLEINDFTITAGAEEARFETYTAVAGETLRLVIVLVDDGDSNVPTMELDGDDLGVTWGTNYVEWVADSAGAKELTLGGALGESFEITCTVDLYYLTGV